MILVLKKNMMSSFDNQVERNLKGKNLEQIREIDKAIELYEANVYEKFEGSFPYRRLAILYRRNKQLLEEIIVLEKAVLVFGKIRESGRSDGAPKLEQFKERLKKLEFQNKTYLDEIETSKEKERISVSINEKSKAFIIKEGIGRSKEESETGKITDHKSIIARLREKVKNSKNKQE